MADWPQACSAQVWGVRGGRRPWPLAGETGRREEWDVFGRLKLARHRSRRRGRHEVWVLGFRGTNLPHAVCHHGQQEEGEGHVAWLVRQVVQEGERGPRGGEEGGEGGGSGGG